jgi:hypothetical protein
MPGKKHLPGATPKQEKKYEAIKESYLNRGESSEEAKRKAAMTVNSQKKKSK